MEKQIIIDEEFKHLMPPLGEAAFNQLEESILADGCLSALVLWESILIDGYNRYEICTKHEIPFDTVSVELPSREAAKLWIIEMQAGRRNLTPTQLFYFRGLHYRTAKKVDWERVMPNANDTEWYQNDTIRQEKRTSGVLADKYHVSRGTIMRDAKASEGVDAIGEISPEAKRKVLTHEVPIGKKALENLAAAPKDEIEQTAKAIVEGTYKKAAGDNIDAMPETDETDSYGAYTYANKDEAADTYPAVSYTHDAMQILTGESYQELLESLRRGDRAHTVTELKDYLSLLENLYKKLSSAV